MPTPTHADLHRDFGRMEGKQDEMGARLDRLEKLIEAGFEKMDERLARLEAKENQRKGAIAALMVFSGFIGGLVVKFGAFIFGSTHP